MNAPAEEAEAHAKVSQRENRLYVGNLPYDCNYKDLEKFMSGGGFELDFLSELPGMPYIRGHQVPKELLRIHQT